MTDPYGQPPQDPYAPQPPQPPTNPYAQPAPPSSAPPVSPSPASPPQYGAYGSQPYSAQPYATPSPYGYSATPPQNTMALVSMILSLVGILSVITAPVGAILGHVAMKQIRQTGESGEGMAKAGIIVGWIFTGIYGLCCGAYIAAIIAGVASSTM